MVCFVSDLTFLVWVIGLLLLSVVCVFCACYKSLLVICYFVCFGFGALI